MNAKIENIVIQGISSYVPENFEDNMDYISLLGERRIKKQIKLTGIRKRHTSLKFQLSSDLAAFAAEKLIRELGWNKEEIGVLIFVVQKREGDYIIPSTAIRLQERLGLPKECVAFDINLGCSAFNYGVQTTATILNSSLDFKKGLCLIGDTNSSLKTARSFNKEALSLRLLSGSAASAIALEKQKGASMIFYGGCDGSNYDAIIKTSLHRDVMMKGNVVFDFAINHVSQHIIDFRQKYSLTENDIDYYVFHQAQKLMLESMINTCDIPPEKVLFSLEEYGNTSGASIPLTLNSNADLVKKKEKVRLLLCGFGVGLSFGITYLEMKTAHITTVGETDKLFDVEKLPKGSLHDLTIMVFDADQLMGEFLSELLDRDDPSLILCGHNETKLKALQEKLHYNSKIISYKDKEEFSIKFKQIHDEQIDGIVNIKEEKIAEWLVTQDFFVKQLSVVLIDTEDQSKKLDKFEYIFRDSLPNARVNMVCYKKGSLDIYIQREEGQSWGYKFLKANLPTDMMRTNYVYHGTRFLLHEDSRFVSGSILHVSDQIEWF